MYVVSENGHAIVIDPCADTTAAEGLTVDYLIVTHEHYDHISGVNAWKERTGAPLLCSRACAGNINNPRKNMSRYFDVFCQMQTWMPAEETVTAPAEYRCEADLVFDGTMTVEWQGHTVTLTEVPGHSLGSIGIDIDRKEFFYGDSLFENVEIELRFPGGSAERWEQIGKMKVAAIPDGASIRPGHFGSFILCRHKQDSVEDGNVCHFSETAGSRFPG